jgi:hypothetical protein
MLDVTATAHALRSRHSRWVYVLPILHLSVSALSFVGFVMPTLQSLAIAFEFLWVADLPFSIVGFILAWQHPTLAMIWMVSVGTLWWYALSCGVEILWKRFKDRGRASLKL